MKPAHRLSSLVKLSDGIYLMQLNCLLKKIQIHTIYIYIIVILPFLVFGQEQTPLQQG